MKKIFVLYFMLFLGGFGMGLEKTEPVRSASELIKICSSTDSEMMNYCEGYIESALYTWKLMTTCASQKQSNQSFCRGAKSAQKSIQKVMSACKDCSLGGFKPELKDNIIRGRLFEERMQKFPTELSAALGVCIPDDQRDEHYCAGYDSQVKNTITEYAVLYSSKLSDKPKDMGMGHAAADVGLHLWSSTAFFGFLPCIKREINSDEAKTLFLKFMYDNPEQKIDTTAIVALEKSLYYSVCPGPALGGVKPNMEQCTKWKSENDYLGTKNTCKKDVQIQFMTKDKQIIERQLSPNETFSTEKQNWWMFATCPVGYMSSVEFSLENERNIRTSQYSCIKK